jgi:hypothetical protein
MAQDYGSNPNAGGSERTGGPLPSGSMDHISDAQIGRVLDWSERSRQSVDPPWWVRLIRWLRTRIYDSNW